ncbi:hypothetical protein ER308_09360 [Egibacter rhizosphaerae]|uniref:DUF1640 domain-containing protein n=1 Tax=Egibacter rhizosphaerae TaxID=1670831 RepID=A0A411YF57_9ACTN|nr:hypothetical protein [Egibacter rhizosphaerae]QBI19737.1 hypothetical protein ER308_09360 [Egibacter rhizosphaerae]
MDEVSRHHAFDVLRDRLDEPTASLIMSHLAPVPAPDLATRADLAEGLDVLGTQLRGEVAEVRGEIVEVRGEIVEVRGEISEVRGEISELRGEHKRDLGRLMLVQVATLIAAVGTTAAIT